MKKIIYIIIISCFGVLSCKKDHSGNTVQTDKSQKVTFNVGFAISSGTFQTNSLKVSSTTPDTSLTNHIKSIYYMVYDSIGRAVSTTNQNLNSADFGHFTTNLRPGKYTVAFAAGPIELSMKLDNLTNTAIIIRPNQVGDYIGYFRDDVFFKKVAITVGSTALNQNVSLDRITSKFVININDAIPSGAVAADVKVASATAYYIGSGQAVNDNSVYGANEFVSNIPVAAIGTKNYQITGKFLGGGSVTIKLLVTNDPGNIALGVSPGDNPGAIIYGQKTIVGPTQSNRITVFSGNLFGGSGTTSTGGFQVGLDSAWNATPVIKTFP